MELKFSSYPWVNSLIADRVSEELGVSAGLGAGKTYGAVQFAVARCLLNSKSPRMAFTEPIYRLIRTTAIPMFQSVLSSIGMREGDDFEVSIGAPVPRITLKRTKQDILFFSASKPNTIVADEYHTAVIDEAGEAPKETFQNLQSRLRCGKAQVRQSLAVGAPQGITEFAKLFAIDEEGFGPSGWSALSGMDFVHQALKRRRIRLRTFDNPAVNGGDVVGYCQRLYRQFGHNQNLIRSYLYGIFCPLFEGSAYDFIASRDIAAEPVEADPFRPLFLSFDFNAFPMAYAAVQILPVDGDFVYTVVEEANPDLRGLEEALFDFCKKFPRSKFAETEIKVYGDRSGHASHHRVKLSDFDYIRKQLSAAGYKNVTIEASKKVAPEAESVDIVNSMFSVGRIMINPHCKLLQNSWQATRWKKGERKLFKPSGDLITHYSDAFKYLIYNLEVLDSLGGGSNTYGVNA